MERSNNTPRNCFIKDSGLCTNNEDLLVCTHTTIISNDVFFVFLGATDRRGPFFIDCRLNWCEPPLNTFYRYYSITSAIKWFCRMNSVFLFPVNEFCLDYNTWLSLLSGFLWMIFLTSCVMHKCVTYIYPDGLIADKNKTVLNK